MVLMRSLAAKLLLRLDSSAKSGGVFTQHVLSECASTLLVSRFHFVILPRGLLATKRKSQGLAHKPLRGFCCVVQPRGSVTKLILFLAVGQFRDVALSLQSPTLNA